MVKTGHCEMGENCNFAHSELELRSTPNIYKTALCNSFMNGECKLGEYCRFAHGEAELRKKPVERKPLMATNQAMFNQNNMQMNNNRNNFNNRHNGMQHHNGMNQQMQQRQTGYGAIQNGKPYNMMGGQQVGEMQQQTQMATINGQQQIFVQNMPQGHPQQQEGGQLTSYMPVIINGQQVMMNVPIESFQQQVASQDHQQQKPQQSQTQIQAQTVQPQYNHNAQQLRSDNNDQNSQNHLQGYQIQAVQQQFTPMNTQNQGQNTNQGNQNMMQNMNNGIGVGVPVPSMN